MTVHDAIQAVARARREYYAIKTQADELRHELHTQYEAVFHHESASKQAMVEAEATLRELILEQSLLQQPLWSLYFMLTDPARYRGWSHPRGDQT